MESISTPSVSLTGLKSLYLKYIIRLKNCHHTGLNSSSKKHILKEYYFSS